jgi:hypothetical protein
MFIQQLFEASAKRIIVTYPGRFQPFHKGHAEVFANLQRQFGSENVFIVTSNKTDAGKSPFNFSDKVRFMHAMGIPNHQIIETDKVYDIPSRFEPVRDQVVFITVVGAPDAKRLNPGATKKDGNPSYFQNIPQNKNEFETADKHGYVIVEPEHPETISIGGKTYDVSHGTPTRELWNQIRDNPQQRGEFVTQLYGRADSDLANTLDKIPTGAAPAPAPAAKMKNVKKDLSKVQHDPNAVAESNDYEHGFADPNAPQLGAGAKAGAKRAELQHELGHEQNNLAIAINGKTWKVIPGKGYADSFEERSYLKNMQNWAAKKSASSGKKWTVHLTGASVTVDESFFGGVKSAIGPWFLKKDGDVLRTVNGQPFTFKSKEEAVKWAMKTYKVSYNQQNIIPTTNPDKNLMTPTGAVVSESSSPVTHRIGLTVTDPNHPMVSKRGETYHKTVRVKGDDREKAINGAIAHYRRKGYKVHDHHYIGTVDNEPMAEAGKGISKDAETKFHSKLDALVHDTFGKRKSEKNIAEFAPPGSGDDGNDGFSDDTLKRMAAQWYNGDEDPRVEKTLMAAGWEIGQDEGYDDEPGVFVVQAGDVNGNSYMSWPANELRQGMAEGATGAKPGWMLKQDPALAKKVKDSKRGHEELKKWAGKPVPKDDKQVDEGAELKQTKRKYNQAAKDANDDQVGAGKKIDDMKKSLRQKDVDNKKQGMAEGKKSDNYHIVDKDGKPASLASYADRASAEKDRDAKHPGAEVRQVGPRGKVKGVSEGLNENAEQLSVGDPVMITGQGIEFEGKTGDIDSFGEGNRFVVVNLYNHGKHSFHSSDVSYNDYADKEDDLDEDLYQYDKEDPYNSEFAPRAGMGRMTLRGWKQQMIKRTAELAQQMSAAGQDIDKSALWDNVHAKLKSMNMDPIAQEIEQAQAELARIRSQGGVRSRAFGK